MLEIPYQTSSYICVKRIASAKTCVLVYRPGSGVLEIFRTIFFDLGAMVYSLFCPAGGDFALSKKFPEGWAKNR